MSKKTARDYETTLVLSMTDTLERLKWRMR